MNDEFTSFTNWKKFDRMARLMVAQKLCAYSAFTVNNTKDCYKPVS